MIRGAGAIALGAASIALAAVAAFATGPDPIGVGDDARVGWSKLTGTPHG
jgi:hypothetical protein